MSRFEFMKELERLLSDIPLDERKEALQYYNDYFEDAGTEHEDEIIRELGTPVRVAGIIKADLKLNDLEHESRGVFTERGFQDTVYQDEKYEIVNAPKSEQEEQQAKEAGNTKAEHNNWQSNQYSGGGNQGYSTYGPGANGSGYQSRGYQSNDNGYQKQKSSTNIALIILLCIFAVPVGIPIFFTVFGLFIAFIAVVFSIVLGFGIAGVVMVPVGIGLFIIGVVQIAVPFTGLALCGSGLLVFGLGVLFILFSVLLCRKVLPAIIRGIVAVCRLPFRNRSVTA